MKWLGFGKPSRNASTYTVPGKISVSFAVLEFCESGSADGEGDPVGHLSQLGDTQVTSAMTASVCSGEMWRGCSSW